MNDMQDITFNFEKVQRKIEETISGMKQIVFNIEEIAEKEQEPRRKSQFRELSYQLELSIRKAEVSLSDAKASNLKGWCLELEDNLWACARGIVSFSSSVENFGLFDVGFKAKSKKSLENCHITLIYIRKFVNLP